jgi:hypothetical protein
VAVEVIESAKEEAMVRKLASKIGLVGVMCLTALGASAVVAPSVAFGRATPPTRIVLTNSSNGQTVVAAKGDIVQVDLKSIKGVRWSEASDIQAGPGVVLLKKSGHISSTGSSVTTFTVVGYGSATLEATGTPPCTGIVCPQYLLVWQATVDAPVQDPPG